MTYTHTHEIILLRGAYDHISLQNTDLELNLPFNLSSHFVWNHLEVGKEWPLPCQAEDGWY